MHIKNQCGGKKVLSKSVKKVRSKSVKKVRSKSVKKVRSKSVKKVRSKSVKKVRSKSVSKRQLKKSVNLKKKKSSIRLSLKKGTLSGYHIKDLAKNRRSILESHLKSGKVSYSEMIKYINVLAIYNKNKNPKMSEKFRRDISYIQKNLSSYSKSNK